MKSKKVKYVWGLSLLAFLVIGVIFSKPLMSLFNGSASTYVDAPDAIYVARDMKTYTHQADIILLGTVRTVTDPYLKSATGITLMQDAQIDVSEVLKGDPNLKNIKVSRLADQIEGFSPENLAELRGKTGLLKPQEKVLLFLGKDSAGDYVVFGGPNGKYLIDQNNNVTSEGDYRSSLDALKTQIQTELKNPASYKPPVFLEEI